MKEEEISVIKTQYSKECPICKKAIRGFSENQVEWNLKTHLKQSHKGVKKR
jgi:hypothetical protein